jgi:hypothetical protein
MTEASVGSTDSLELWRTEVGPVLEALVAVSKSAQRAVFQGKGSVLAASDQLRAESRRIMSWLPTHPSPYADVNWLLARTARSYAALARLFAKQARNSNGINLDALDRETRGTNRALSKTMAMIRDLTGT